MTNKWFRNPPTSWQYVPGSFHSGVDGVRLEIFFSFPFFFDRVYHGNIRDKNTRSSWPGLQLHSNKNWSRFWRISPSQLSWCFEVQTQPVSTLHQHLEEVEQVLYFLWLWGNDHIYRMVKESNSNIQHCIWPIRPHYTFVSTNDYICRILTAAACYSSLQLLPSYIWSLMKDDAVLVLC